MSLVDFLLARLAEDEDFWRTVGESGQAQPRRVARMLSDVAAKRAIVWNHEQGRLALMRECDAYTWETRVLASVYSDHPDYRDEWRP